MGGNSFGGAKNSKIKAFKVTQTYHAALNNYYLHESTLEINGLLNVDDGEIQATVKLNFSSTEANSRVGSPIKDEEILDNTNFPMGGKKYEDIFWGNFNFIKPTEEMRKVILK